MAATAITQLPLTHQMKPPSSRVEITAQTGCWPLSSGGSAGLEAGMAVVIGATALPSRDPQGPVSLIDGRPANCPADQSFGGRTQGCSDRKEQDLCVSGRGDLTRPQT